MTPPPCGCKVTFVHNQLSGSEGDPVIVYCELHANAHRLREALEFCLKYGDFEESCTDNKLASNCLDKAQALLRSCEKGKGT